MRKSFYFKLSRRVILHGGVSKRFGIGICIDRWGIDLDIGPLWVSIEWWYKL
jgi:hypothetical protein